MNKSTFSPAKIAGVFWILNQLVYRSAVVFTSAINFTITRLQIESVV